MWRLLAQPSILASDGALVSCRCATQPLDREIETLVDIVVRSAGDHSPLVSALRKGLLTNDQTDDHGPLVTEELAARGFDAKYEPISYGVQLENLIDVLNHA